MEALREFELFLEYCHHEVSAESRPHLSEDGVSAGSEEGFDPQVTLDPLEEKFHAPPQLVEPSDGQSWQVKVVRQEHQYFSGFRITEGNPSQFLRVLASAFGRGHSYDLVATQSSGPINRARLNAGKPHAPFCTRHEEGANHYKEVESCEIEIAAVHDVEAPRFENDFVKCMNNSAFPISDVHECWDWPPHIEQGMELDGGISAPVSSPWKEGQAEIDSRGIQCVHRLVDVFVKRLRRVELPCPPDQVLGQIGVDAPVTCFIGFRQSGASNRTRQTQLRPSTGYRVQARFNVAQAFAMGQLGENQTNELCPAGEMPNFVIAAVPADTAVKLLSVDHRENLRKNERALI